MSVKRQQGGADQGDLLDEALMAALRHGATGEGGTGPGACEESHDILMCRLARRVGDKSLLRIIRRFLQAGMRADGVCSERHEGTTQGGPMSPLLANLLLDDLDKESERMGHRFCRYADDCNISTSWPATA